MISEWPTGIAAADSVSDPGATKQVKAARGGIRAVNHTPVFLQALRREKRDARMTFTYANLDDAVGKMQRAAVDCHMADQQFYPNWGNDMIYAKWGFMLNFYNRTDEQGQGGGTGNGVNHSVADVFETIRAQVAEVVEPWRGLPDGSGAAAPARMTNAAASKLGAKSAEAGITDGGEIDAANTAASGLVLNNLTGAFRAPLYDKYFMQFTTVHKRLAEACMMLSLNYKTQSAMWKPAQEDVARICAAAHSLLRCTWRDAHRTGRSSEQDEVGQRSNDARHIC